MSFGLEPALKVTELFNMFALLKKGWSSRPRGEAHVAMGNT